MGGQLTRRRRSGVLLAFTLAMGTTLVTSTSQASAAPDVVRLHLGTDFQAFTYGSETQTLRTGRNTCAIASPAGTVMALSANGNQAPGLSNNSIGIKATRSSSNGTPCGQVDPAEVLTLRPGSALGGRTFSAVRLDLEMTGNAVVVLTLSNSSESRTFRLQTGTSITEPIADLVPPYLVESDKDTPVAACAAPNSSGPNSFANDNCLWTVTPGIDFDTVTLTTSIGTVSLEGSSDFGNDPAFDSLFFLSNSAPVAVDDVAEVNENDSVEIDVLANDSDVDGDVLKVISATGATKGSVTVTDGGGSVTYTPDPDTIGTDSFIYTVSDGNGGSDSATVSVTIFPVICTNQRVSVSLGTTEGIFDRLSDDEDCKRYVLQADGTTVLFVPEGGGSVQYRGYVSFGPKPAPSGSLTIGLEYDPAGGTTFRAVKWCLAPQFEDGAVTEATLPAGETWCIASETTSGASGGIETIWQVYGEDDPRFR